MPSIAVHLCVSAILAERLGIVNFEDLFLGSIAPDSVNVNGFASQEQRYGAHIRSRDVSIWLKNIENFKAENKSKISERKDLYNGFLLHLYTDIAWDETVQPELFDFLRSKGISEDKLNEKKWDELRGFDSTLSQSDEYKQAVAFLAKAEPADIGVISAELLSEWRDKIVTLTYPYPPSGFLNTEHIRTAAERAFELMTK